MGTNPYLSEFASTVHVRYPVDTEQMSLSDWLVANTSNPRRPGVPFSFEGHEFQRAIADDLSRNLAVIKPSQVGMALALDTPIVIPSGWTTMGEIQVGDTVYDEQGQLCRVEYVSPVFEDHDCYQLTFCDGETIVADAGHRWYVESSKAFSETGLHGKTGRIRLGSGVAMKGVLTTEVISRTYKRGCRNIYAVPTTKPLLGQDVDLPVDPYFLGAWLGDGNLHASVLTAGETDADEMVCLLEARGMVCKFSSQRGSTVQFCVQLPDNPSWRKDSLPARLKALGLLSKRKFIPPNYLRAPRQARIELLRGLLDTDGSITTNGRVSFHNTNRDLVEGVNELARSLGFKPRTRWRLSKPATMKNGQVITAKQPVAEVSFVAYAEEPVFALSRKQSRLGRQSVGRHTESFRRRIVGVEKIPSVPTRCISVSSSSHLFLAGRGMIPTHNTEIQIRKCLAFLARNRGTSVIFSLPSEKMFKRVSKTRVRPLVTKERALQTPGLLGGPAVASMDLFDIQGSFLYLTGMTEGDATSIPADFLAHDEVDLCDETMIGLYQSRLQASNWKITQKFSTPTLPNYGIDAAYTVSDQKEYMCKCSRCTHWQIPTFSEPFVCLPGYHGDTKLREFTDRDLVGVDLADAYVKCERCSKPLDTLNPDLREWVARYPGRRVSGYRIRPFTTQSLSLAYVIEQLLELRRMDQLKGWYNTVLGEPYTDGANQLTEAACRAVMVQASRPEIGSLVPIAMGIDVGRICHLIMGPLVGGQIMPAHFERVHSEQLVERVTEISRTHNLICGAIDRLPYTPTANAVREATRGRILPVQYAGSAAINIVQDEFGDNDHAKVNRTSAIDRLVGRVNRRNIELSGYLDMTETLIQHMTDMVRVENPEVEARWNKVTGNDHFMHALVLGNLAPRLLEVVQLSKPQTVKTVIALAGISTMVDKPLIGSGRSEYVYGAA